MIAWLMIVMMGSVMGSSIVLMVLRMRSMQEFSCYVGRITAYRAAAEGICIVAIRRYQRDRYIQKRIQEMGSYEVSIDVPGEDYRAWRGRVTYEIASSRDLVVVVALFISPHNQHPVMNIKRVVEPVLLEYTVE